MASIHVLGLVCFSLILSTHSVLAAIDYEQALTKPLAAIDYDQALTKPLAAIDNDQALTKPLAAIDNDQALTKPLAAIDYEEALTKPLAAIDYEQALTKPLAAIDYEQALTKPPSAIDYEQAFTKSLAAIDYKQALTKSLLYFEAQRSGKLPPGQRVQWRGDSALKDGSDAGVDLDGGYYDAGDNVKFGFPMAFTITMLSWSTIEFASKLETKNELSNALDAIKWGTDYLIKAHPQPNVLYGEVGDGGSDHTCWQRPEDMTTPRTSFKIDEQHPGSDLAGETAAAFAAASIAFKDKDPTYSGQLLTHAKQLFEFARSHAGVYQNSINVAGQFYSSSGYEDELLWAAAWLHRATDDKSYLDYLGQAGNTGGARTVFSWDDKFVGAQVLVAKLVLEGKVPADSGPWSQYKNQAEQFICSCIQKGNNNVKKTPGGLLWFLPFNNLQYTAAATLIATVYSEYLSPKRASIQCSGGIVQAPALLDLARSQVDYILGSNPNGMSYMVGFGSKYPTQIHHRGASIVSIKKDPSPVACQAGFDAWFNKNAPNPNVLDGAIVGGPNDSDGYTDSRSNFQMAEAATVNTAPLVGVLAKLA